MTQAEDAGVEPNVAMYNTLLSKLQHEGKPLEPVLEQMRVRGIDMDTRTKEVLDRPAEEISRRRTAELKQRLQGGEAEAASELLDRLLQSRHANAFHVNVMEARGCHTSDEAYPTEQTPAFVKQAGRLSDINDSTSNRWCAKEFKNPFQS